MSIQVKCPNADCGRTLSVSEELSGKKGRCPSCGTAFIIPGPAHGEPYPGRSPTSSQRSYRDFAPGDEAGRQAAPEAEVVGDSARGDDLDISRPSADRRKSLGRGMSASVMTNVAFAAGISALVVLSLVPLTNWIFIIESGSRTGRGDRQTPDIPRGPAVFDFVALPFSGGTNFAEVGTAFLIFSTVTAVLALLAFALSSALPAETADPLVTAGSSAALAWGTTAFFWLLAFVWKAFTLWSKIADRRAPGSLEPKITILPGVGLFLGLLAALLIIAAFTYLIISRRKLNWLFTAAGLGFVLGIFLLILNVKPWHISGNDVRAVPDPKLGLPF